MFSFTPTDLWKLNSGTIFLYRKGLALIVSLHVCHSLFFIILLFVPHSSLFGPAPLSCLSFCLPLVCSSKAYLRTEKSLESLAIVWLIS